MILAPGQLQGEVMKRVAEFLVLIGLITAFGSSTAAQAPANNQGARPRRPIVLNPDDKPAFDDPPAGFNAKRDDIPHGKTEMIEYESKTVGTRRKTNVYTPPGYSAEKKYPVLHLLHGIGGD